MGEEAIYRDTHVFRGQASDREGVALHFVLLAGPQVAERTRKGKVPLIGGMCGFFRGWSAALTSSSDRLAALSVTKAVDA